MNYRELFGVRTKVYPNLVKLFYANMSYTASIKGADFGLATTSLD